jgi:hypothetical protein
MTTDPLDRTQTRLVDVEALGIDEIVAPINLVATGWPSAGGSGGLQQRQQPPQRLCITAR